MNILFVNYGDFRTNSLGHIGPYADELCRLGHTCVVAVPDGSPPPEWDDPPLYLPCTYGELLRRPARFPDRRPADIVHAWTPRRTVVEFACAYLALSQARLLVHLEDDESFLTQSLTGKTLSQLRALDEKAMLAGLPSNCTHPDEMPFFLALADGVSLIRPELQATLPGGGPSGLHILRPGVEESFFQPKSDPGLKLRLGVDPDEMLLFYPGSTNFATHADIRSLLLMVQILRERGLACRLVRTGFMPEHFKADYSGDWSQSCLDLGWLCRKELPALLASADVLVQPGVPGAFNAGRLPAKLPEFLASGRPVVAPRIHLTGLAEDGRDVLVHHSGSPGEMADLVWSIHTDPGLALRLSSGGVEVARKYFSLKTNSRALLQWYESIRNHPPNAWQRLVPPPSDLAHAVLALPECDGIERAQFLLRMLDRSQLEQDRMRRHAEELEKGIHLLRQEQQDLRASGPVARELQEARMEARQLQEKVDFLRQEAVRWQEEDSTKTASLARELDQLAERLRRRENSISWRMTAPLRWLRRCLLDRWLGRAEGRS